MAKRVVVANHANVARRTATAKSSVIAVFYDDLDSYDDFGYSCSSGVTPSTNTSKDDAVERWKAMYKKDETFDEMVRRKTNENLRRLFGG